MPHEEEARPIPVELEDEVGAALVFLAKTLASKIAGLDPGANTRRPAMIQDLREVVTLYARYRNPTLFPIEDFLDAETSTRLLMPLREVSVAFKDRESPGLEFDFESGHQLRLGHGEGWVVANVYRGDQPIVAFHGTAAQAREAALGIAYQAAAAAEPHDPDPEAA